MPASKLIFLLVRFFLICIFTAACSLQAQIPRGVLLPSPTPPGATNAAAVGGSTNSALQAAEERLAKVRTEMDLRSTSGVAYARRSLLKRLERLYEQEISKLAEIDNLKSQKELINREAQGWTDFAQPPPYSILLTDDLREAVHAERTQIAKCEAALKALKELSEDQQRLLKQTEEKLRLLNEDLEKAEDPALTRERALERLRSQVSVAVLGVLDLERRIQEQTLEIRRTKRDLFQKQLIIARSGTVFTEADIQKVRTLIEREEKQVQNELVRAQERQTPATKALEEAQQALTEVLKASATNSAAVERAEELVAVRQAQLEAVHVSVNALRFILQANGVANMIWEARFETHQRHTSETLRQTDRQLAEFRSRIALWRDFYDSQLAAVGSQIAQQDERVAALDPASDLSTLVRDRLAALHEQDQILLRVVRQIERCDRLVQRLAESLREASERLPFAARARNIFVDARSFLSRLWNFELFVAQDTIEVEGHRISGKRSVTLSKILTAVLILVVGYWLTDLLSRWAQPIVVKRFKIDVNQAGLIRRWVRAVLVLILAVFSLVFVKIPLTVFAFAGGALAIALGFGMQTLLKNFVSGIIILFERPFRVGDVLDVGGQQGKVVSVGIRSSVLQQWNGTETLIPNSVLLESSVTNWTYTNRKVRFIVTVGVAYGSDARRVVQLLTEVTERHGLIEKDPAPQVLLTNFGDSVLTFEIRFWADVIKANSSQVASDLRQMIAVVFAEQGIAMAFPQRDIHLDSGGPIKVQVVPAMMERPSQAPEEVVPGGPSFVDQVEAKAQPASAKRLP